METKSKLTNFEIMNVFLDIFRDTMFSEITAFPFGRILFSQSEQSPFWNYALVDKVLNEKELMGIEENLTSRYRKPMIYFESRPELVILKEHLLARGYSLFSEDSWMFYENTWPLAVDTNTFSSVRRVESEAELKVWIETMDKSYVVNDPQNPYGPIGTYAALAERAWKANHKEGVFDYFIAFKDDKPVAVATLTQKGALGYISNVGSLPEVRGEGYGKLITLFCVNESLLAKNTDTFLATEEGTYPNVFYKKIGFKTRFTGPGFVKK
jgi:hypothetical protein